MKHSVAMKIVRQALEEADPRLQVSLLWPDKLPSSSRKEIDLSINTGPGTMMVHAWIKQGQLQTEEVKGSSYVDLNDPNEVAKWAQARTSLIRSQVYKAAIDRNTKNWKTDWEAVHKELDITPEPMPDWMKKMKKMKKVKKKKARKKKKRIKKKKK